MTEVCELTRMEAATAIAKAMAESRGWGVQWQDDLPEALIAITKLQQIGIMIVTTKPELEPEFAV